MIRRQMAETDLFKDLTPHQLDEVSRLATHCVYKKEEVVFEQNQYAEFLYIILSGEVTIRFKPYDGELIQVATIHPGGLAGWSSVLGRAIYTSAAICTDDAECARIRGRDLQRLCQTSPETGIIILERLAGVVAERLTDTNDQILSLLSKNVYRKSETPRRKRNEYPKP